MQRSRPSQTAGRPLAIASWNGLEAVKVAYRHLTAGADPAEAAVEGVTVVELDPGEFTVGYGGLPNFDGVVQLDAAVMHGPTGRAGAVAALEGVKTPARVARLVMERTHHVLLVGDGARQFADMYGFPREDLLTETARKIWVYWRENLSQHGPLIETPVAALDPEVRKFIELNRSLFRPEGTIHLSALSGSGDIGCCTSTSGLPFKSPGRVGDSPLVGAGLYCENEVGSAGATGRGEAAILAGVSHLAVEFMRLGRTPREAVLETLERVVKLVRDARLRDADGRPAFNLNVYALDKSGRYGGASIWSGGHLAVADPDGARLEPLDYLYERREDGVSASVTQHWGAPAKGG